MDKEGYFVGKNMSRVYFGTVRERYHLGQMQLQGKRENKMRKTSCQPGKATFMPVARRSMLHNARRAKTARAATITTLDTE